MIWIYERILREVRSRHRTYISKVIQHPSKVMEVQIKKEKCKTRAGQYIFLSCPEVSYFQWHPFTLTSAPEEDYISVHIRVVGDWTNAFAKALGCDFDSKDRPEKGDEGKVVPPPVNRVLPRVMVDGPFGSASEDFLKYETVLLVGAGIGVTPFASILKSIWYRMNGFNQSKPTRLSKVYFTWVIRDFGSAEWFHSLLKAIEDQDSMRRIEISIYLTAKIKDDDATNIMVRFVFCSASFISIRDYPNGAPFVPSILIVFVHVSVFLGVGPRRWCRERRDQWITRPHALWQAQLGPRFPVYRRGGIFDSRPWPWDFFDDV